MKNCAVDNNGHECCDLRRCKAFWEKRQEDTHCRMNCTASSYFIPLSMRAKATRTGALRGEGQGEKERKGGGKNRRLKVRVHTGTKSYARGKKGGGALKPGKGAWETYRGA